jgi:hypothetical protein
MEVDSTAPEFVNDWFWEARTKWPHDPPGYVFLARAFDEIGRLMYGDQWTEAVTKTSDPDLPAPGSAKSVWDQFWRDGEQWADELELAEASRDQKWTKVTRSIAESCESGTLVTAAQQKSSGDMIKLEASFWNTEKYASYFYDCDASLVAPKGKGDHWIYVTRESLNAYLDALSLAKRRRGRPPGAGSLQEIDEPLIQKMRQLLRDGSATSPNDAAKQIAGEATGNSPKAKQARLRKRFMRCFPDWKQKLRSN